LTTSICALSADDAIKLLVAVGAFIVLVLGGIAHFKITISTLSTKDRLKLRQRLDKDGLK
jgi:hypothetical protein